MGRSPGRLDVRRFPSVLAPVMVLTALAALIAASGASARAKPKCFGQAATIVGTNGADHIQGTAHKDVIAALGGNDTIETKDVKRNHGNDIICGGNGNDTIRGDPDSEKIIGGPGNDIIAAGNGNDLVVGDNANPNGDESGPTGNDALAGSGGADFMVGDNYASGNATGASPDTKLKGFKGGGGGDTIIGDDASVGTGNAIGGANDRMGGADGNDLVIGDSYTVSGNAIGGGDDDNNSGPGQDLAVGDSYTVNGTASSGVGEGDDNLHAADGGDFDIPCDPVSSCDDVFYGDNFAASCGLEWSICSHVSGGGFDLLNTDEGADFMNGGPPSTDGGGKLRDRCSGGPDAPDVSYQCEYNYPDVEQPH
jgi:hypothetical protein